jgi:acetylglutamate kinase
METEAMSEFAGQTVVLRLDDATLATDGTTLFSDLTFLAELGVRPIVVAPSEQSARTIVRLMNRTGDTAVGLSGADAGMIPAANGTQLGAVQTRLLTTLLAAGYVPVIEPLAFGLFGKDVAVGPDDVTRALAQAIAATRAIFFHDAGGVIDAHTKMLIDELTPAEALALADDVTLADDLRTAVRAAALGVRGGVGAAQIVDGRIAHAAIVEFLTARHIGTQVAGTVFMA